MLVDIPAGNDGPELVGAADVVVLEVVVGTVAGRVVLVDVVPGAGGACPQDPNSGWHPVPQYEVPLPHQKNSEQHEPKPVPAHVVELPHMPLVLATSVPVGPTVEDVVELLREVVVVLVLVDVGLLVVEVVEVVDDEVDDGIEPSHAPYWAWHPAMSEQ